MAGTVIIVMGLAMAAGARVVNVVSGLLLAGLVFLLVTNRRTALSRELVEIMDGTPFGWLAGL